MYIPNLSYVLKSINPIPAWNNGDVRFNDALNYSKFAITKYSQYAIGLDAEACKNEIIVWQRIYSDLKDASKSVESSLAHINITSLYYRNGGQFYPPLLHLGVIKIPESEKISLEDFNKLPDFDKNTYLNKDNTLFNISADNILFIGIAIIIIAILIILYMMWG